MRVFTGIAIVLATVVAPLIYADPSINVGSHDLLANTANQTVEIFVTGGDEIEGLNLHVQVDDGSNTNGPTIQSVDAITSTIFADPNNEGGQDDIFPEPQLFSTFVFTPLGTPVSADGLLATITLDTTGVFSGTYDLKLAGTLNGDTNLGLDSNDDLIQPIVVNGQITVVPEPTSALLLAAGGVMLVIRRKRAS